MYDTFHGKCLDKELDESDRSYNNMYFFSFFVEYCKLHTVVAHASLRNEAFDSDALGQLQRSCQSDDG